MKSETQRHVRELGDGSAIRRGWVLIRGGNLVADGDGRPVAYGWRETKPTDDPNFQPGDRWLPLTSQDPGMMEPDAPFRLTASYFIGPDDVLCLPVCVPKRPLTKASA